jgi:exonuclease SbcD
MARDVMKLLHTSDLQLGAPFTFLGEKGQDHRQQLLDTLDAIVDLALEEGCDLLLIAGDLFDSNHPPESTIERVRSSLARLNKPTCILPGNHDPFDSKSTYRRVVFPSSVTIFTNQVRELEFPDLGLTVYGNAIIEKDSRESPLRGIQAKEGKGWQVAIAHGNLDVGRGKNPFRPIQLEEIAACGMDYVALGDWHSFADYSQGRVKAFYSGSPEPMAFDQDGSGYVARVTLDEDGVQVEKVRVGRISARRLEIDLTGRDQSVLEELIAEESDRNLMLEVVLEGLREIGSVLDPIDLEERFSNQVYALRILDQSHVQLQEPALDEFPEEHIAARYIEIINRRIAAAEEEAEISKLERALQIGVALLQGKEVI